jgi:hypothetical protein
MQIMGCTLSYRKHSALVDVKTKQMILSEERNIKNESVWSLWEPDFQDPIWLIDDNTTFLYNLSAVVSFSS